MSSEFNVSMVQDGYSARKNLMRKHKKYVLRSLLVQQGEPGKQIKGNDR